MIDNTAIAVRAMSRPIDDFRDTPDRYFSNKQKMELRYRAAIECMSGDGNWLQNVKELAKSMPVYQKGSS